MHGALAFTVSTLLLTGCAKQAHKASEAQTQTLLQLQNQSQLERKRLLQKATEDFKAHYNEFYFDGVKISLPCVYTELEALGFHSPGSSDGSDTVAPESVCYGSLGLKESQWAYSVAFGYKGGKGERVLLEEADIISFEWYTESPDSNKFVFYGGINKDSTREEVAQVLDLSYEDEEDAIYTTMLDQTGFDEMSVTFLGDTISSIQVDVMTEYLPENSRTRWGS